MRQRYYILLISVLWAMLYVNSGWADTDHEHTPREYCVETGGKLSESGNRAIYFCCYPDQHKCVLSNIEKGYSRLITLGTYRPVSEADQPPRCFSRQGY